MYKYRLKDNKELIIENDYDFSYDLITDLLDLTEFKFYTFMDRYEIGHEHDFSEPNEVIEHYANDVNAIILDVFAYIHSGITISLGSFNCQWDSGQCGYLVITSEAIKTYFGEITPETRKQAMDLAEEFIEKYVALLQGDVWSFVIVEKETCDLGHVHDNVLDSCSGFIGQDFEANGLLENAGLTKDDLLEESISA